MRTVNRAALIVRPKEPYLRWAASVDDGAAAVAGVLRTRVAVYLVAEDPEGEQETAPLENYYERIFEAELEAWYRDESRWPVTRDLKTFLEWFEVTGESRVVDLETSKLRAEEY